MALLREHNQIIREHVSASNGYEVKSIGDGFMLAFCSARDGLNCAIGIQRGIAKSNEATPEPIRVRIGGSATGGEILVSSLFAQLVGPSGEFALSERPVIALKGLDGHHVMHAVGWR